MVPTAHRAPRDPLGRTRDGSRPTARQAATQTPGRRRRRRAQCGPHQEGTRRRPRRRDRRRRRPGRSADRSERDSDLTDGTPTPDPLDHASADVDQAKLAEQGAVPPEIGDADNEYDGGYDDFDDLDRAPDEAEDDAVVVSADPDAHERPARKQRGRVLTFLRHCAEELRRVQWPNRRQVGQATAVVLGFVVLAGGYLGLLDALWKPIIDAIL